MSAAVVSLESMAARGARAGATCSERLDGVGALGASRGQGRDSAGWRTSCGGEGACEPTHCEAAHAAPACRARGADRASGSDTLATSDAAEPPESASSHVVTPARALARISPWHPEVVPRASSTAHAFLHGSLRHQADTARRGIRRLLHVSGRSVRAQASPRPSNVERARANATSHRPIGSSCANTDRIFSGAS